MKNVKILLAVSMLILLANCRGGGSKKEKLYTAKREAVVMTPKSENGHIPSHVRQKDLPTVISIQFEKDGKKITVNHFDTYMWIGDEENCPPNWFRTVNDSTIHVYGAVFTPSYSIAIKELDKWMAGREKATYTKSFQLSYHQRMDRQFKEKLIFNLFEKDVKITSRSTFLEKVNWKGKRTLNIEFKKENK